MAVRVQVKLFATLRKYRPDLGHGEAANLELFPARGYALISELAAAGKIPPPLQVLKAKADAPFPFLQSFALTKAMSQPRRRAICS